MTVVELIKQLFHLIPNSRLLVATPSNSAANIFTEALKTSDEFKDHHDFIRFVSNNQIEKELIPDELKPYCGTISVSSDNNATSDITTYDKDGIRLQCTKSKIVNYRICIATLSCMGSLMQIKFPKDHFTHVIIDESGQSTEALSLIPMTLIAKNSGQVILAGDPKQLGPIMISRFSKNFKMDTSMLERLLNTNPCYAKKYGANGNEYDPRFVTKLKINYRSIPGVLKVYNDLFYDSELEGVVDDETSFAAKFLSFLEDDLWNNTTANKKCGVYFINIAKGHNLKVAESCSWYNEEELNAVYSFLNKIEFCKIPFKHVGVVS